jgi:hypothetical protein
MSEGQSQRSVALSAQHRQEAEVAVAEERERAAAEIAATTARLTMAEPAAARAEAEAVATAAELKLCAPVAPIALFLPATTETTSSSWRGRQHGSRRRSGQPHTPRGAVAAALTGADAPVAGLTEIAAFTGGVALPPRIGTMGSRPLSGTSVPATSGLSSPRPTTSSEPR